jgi:hypothetical protein
MPLLSIMNNKKTDVFEQIRQHQVEAPVEIMAKAIQQVRHQPWYSMKWFQLGFWALLVASGSLFFLNSKSEDEKMVAPISSIPTWPATINKQEHLQLSSPNVAVTVSQEKYKKEQVQAEKVIINTDDVASTTKSALHSSEKSNSQGGLIASEITEHEQKIDSVTTKLNPQTPAVQPSQKVSGQNFDKKIKLHVYKKPN